MITIYTIAYNEELMIPYFMRHYRAMFPNSRIVVYDNESTDKTVDIVLTWGNVEVITYKTNNKLSDQAYLDIKNNCWKDAKTDWVLIADVDEHCYINQNQLASEKASIIKFKGYNMVNHNKHLDIDRITNFLRAPSYDKLYLFNKTKISEINYGAGCHRAFPKGEITYSRNTYPVRHYKYINPDYMVKRHAMYRDRLSEENKKRGWGCHYMYSEESIRKEFAEAIKKSK